jgi:hypothetical protein
MHKNQPATESTKHWLASIGSTVGKQHQQHQQHMQGRLDAAAPDEDVDEGADYHPPLTIHGVSRQFARLENDITV